jgi:hypothetical protein
MPSGKGFYPSSTERRDRDDIPLLLEAKKKVQTGWFDQNLFSQKLV